MDYVLSDCFTVRSVKKRNSLIVDNGARGRNRTGTVLPPRDFKSLASTNFATRAAL